MLNLKSSAIVGVAALALTGAPAQAQYMMHLDPNLYMLVAMNMYGGPNTCLTGIAPSDKKVAEARAAAPGAMQRYFATAQGGGLKSASFRASKRASWTLGGTAVPLSGIDAQQDPLAMAGNRLAPEAVRFFRSGDSQSAQGQWQVNRADGSIAGLYDAVLKREKELWKLERLTLYRATDPVAPAMQYCSAPGDVTEHKVKSAADRITYLEKEMIKAQEKLDKAKAELASGEAALAAKPGGTAQREAVRTARQDVSTREKRLTELKDSLTKAQEYRDKSNRDKTEIAAMTLPATDAHRFRDFETTTAREEAVKKAEEDAKRAEEQARKRAARGG